MSTAGPPYSNNSGGGAVVGSSLEVAAPLGLLVGGDGGVAHGQLGHDGRDQSRHDELRSAGRLGHKHHRRQRHPIAGSQEGGDTDDRKEGAARLAKKGAEDAADERPL